MSLPGNALYSLYTNLTGRLNKGEGETKECTPQVAATQCCVHWWRTTTGDVDSDCHGHVTGLELDPCLTPYLGLVLPSWMQTQRESAFISQWAAKAVARWRVLTANIT